MSNRTGLSLSALAAATTLTACGGSSTPSTAAYTIGGSISGLNVSTVQLELETETSTAASSQSITVSAGTTSWTFPTAEAANSSYAIAVETQPAGEVCEITGGATGTLSANITNVSVSCSSNVEWTWVAGANTVGAEGVYGLQGSPLLGDAPGARDGSSSWIDASGNLWLFGGYGDDSVGNTGSLNDLWQYAPSTGLWTWMGGSATINAAAVYGTQGTASTGNVPGARYGSSYWTDASGNLWLFGGYGYVTSSSSGDLNDLWEYTPSTRQWTWVSGSNVTAAAGVYGTQNTAASGNVPGARYGAAYWIDTSGNLWLFGGYGYDSSGSVGDLNDLWKYTPGSGQWTWVSGSEVRSAGGVYGSQGAASTTYSPGSRQGASSWIDSTGNLWLFGGYGHATGGNAGNLNDLWKFNPTSGEWTWMGGTDQINASGVYGSQDVASSANVPAARQGATSWIDSSGNMWLFGGSSGSGDLNDLWQFNPTSGEWMWVSGQSQANANGSYGPQGGALATNTPGARQLAAGWIDASNHLWLFGGAGYGASGSGYLNDLWEFVPP